MKLLNAHEVQHVPMEENIKANILSKLASTKPKENNQSLIQETLKSPFILEPLPILALEGISNWMTPINQYLRNGTQMEDPIEAKRLAREASYYTTINGQLYRRGLSQLLLKCIGPD